MDKLKYYGGDGFDSCRQNGEFLVKYGEENESAFTDFKEAKEFYDSLNEPKAFWDGVELIDAWYI